MKVIDTISEKHITQLHELYKNEWWTNTRTLEETKKVVIGSQISIGIVNENDDLIGFARVLTDYIFKALIFDVITQRELRNIGIGQKIMTAIMDHEKLEQVKHFELYCLQEMKAYYEKFGFSTDTGGIILMRYTAEQ